MGGQEIHIASLDAAIAQFEALIRTRHNADLQQLLEQSLAWENLATQTIMARAALIEEFLAETLTVSGTDVPNLGGLLKRPLSYRLAQVGSVTIRPHFDDVPTGPVVDIFSALLVVEGRFEIVCTSSASDRRLGLDEDAMAHLQREALLDFDCRQSDRPSSRKHR